MLCTYTYILFSTKIKRFYTGQTEDIERRLEEHNRGKTPFMANGYTMADNLFKNAFYSRDDAMKLEKFIKKKGCCQIS